MRSEKIINGQKTAYSEYDYDSDGNIGAQALYNRQASGEYKLSLLFVYLYFTDGNLYKQLTFIPIAGSEEHQLISTRTYEGYSNVLNPFPAIEIVPGVVAQRTLPASYRLEENGADLLYQFSYQYRADGLPARRATSGAGQAEMTTYQYY